MFIINLAVADLFVGFTELISIGTYSIPGHLKQVSFNSARNKNNLAAFQITFGFGSVLFLTLISLERAYALIWPLRHRGASTKVYSYSATLTWIAAILAGVTTFLTVFDVMDSAYWKVVLVGAKVLCLATISVSYLAIRTRLNSRVPVINGAHIRIKEPQQNAKLSRTLLIMISASLLFWAPSVVGFTTQVLCSECVPLIVYHISTMFRLANSLVNPIIYSFRILIFRETFKRVKTCKNSKEYTINYTPRI